MTGEVQEGTAREEHQSQKKQKQARLLFDFWFFLLRLGTVALTHREYLDNGTGTSGAGAGAAAGI
jgi:hypothetical protein